VDSIIVDKYKVTVGLRYSNHHGSVNVDGNGAKMGMTDYAQKSLHEVVYADLPKVGLTIYQRDPIGTVESTKSVLEIYSSLSGGVIKANEKLADSPELSNESSYGGGWTLPQIRMPIANLSEQTLKRNKQCSRRLRCLNGKKTETGRWNNGSLGRDEILPRQ